MRECFISAFNKLNHFSCYEKWGDHTKINGLLLILLDKITDKVKLYAWQKYKKTAFCIIHCAYEKSGHSPNSQHYLGNAADFHFENISTKEAYEIILEVLGEYQVKNFVGLGIYPDWYKKGFHLDVRSFKARWARVDNIYVDIEQGIKLL